MYKKLTLAQSLSLADIFCSPDMHHLDFFRQPMHILATEVNTSHQTISDISVDLLAIKDYIYELCLANGVSNDVLCVDDIPADPQELLSALVEKLNGKNLCVPE